MTFSIFPGGRFAQLGNFLWWETEICFQVSFFSQGVEIIYSRAYWFFKIWLPTPVWIKNGKT